MILYFILFSAIGVTIGSLVKEQKIAFGIIIAIAIIWGLTHRHIWGFVALGELFLGYFAYLIFKKG